MQKLKKKNNLFGIFILLEVNVGGGENVCQYEKLACFSSINKCGLSYLGLATCIKLIWQSDNWFLCDNVLSWFQDLNLDCIRILPAWLLIFQNAVQTFVIFGTKNKWFCSNGVEESPMANKKLASWKTNLLGRVSLGWVQRSCGPEETRAVPCVGSQIQQHAWTDQGEQLWIGAAKGVMERS